MFLVTFKSPLPRIMRDGVIIQLVSIFVEDVSAIRHINPGSMPTRTSSFAVLAVEICGYETPRRVSLYEKLSIDVASDLIASLVHVRGATEPNEAWPPL